MDLEVPNRNHATALTQTGEQSRTQASSFPLAIQSQSTGYPVAPVGISRRLSRDIPRRSLGIPMGSNGILACKSFRSWDHAKKRLFRISDIKTESACHTEGATLSTASGEIHRRFQLL